MSTDESPGTPARAVGSHKFEVFKLGRVRLDVIAPEQRKLRRRREPLAVCRAQPWPSTPAGWAPRYASTIAVELFRLVVEHVVKVPPLPAGRTQDVHASFSFSLSERDYRRSGLLHALVCGPLRIERTTFHLSQALAVRGRPRQRRRAVVETRGEGTEGKGRDNPGRRPVGAAFGAGWQRRSRRSPTSVGGRDLSEPVGGVDECVGSASSSGFTSCGPDDEVEPALQFPVSDGLSQRGSGALDSQCPANPRIHAHLRMEVMHATDKS